MLMVQENYTKSIIYEAYGSGDAPTRLTPLSTLIMLEQDNRKLNNSRMQLIKAKRNKTKLNKHTKKHSN